MAHKITCDGCGKDMPGKKGEAIHNYNHDYALKSKRINIMVFFQSSIGRMDMCDDCSRKAMLDLAKELESPVVPTPPVA